MSQTQKKATAQQKAQQPSSRTSTLLQAAYLRSASSGQLLGRLLEIYQALDEAQPPFPLERSFVDELLKKEYLQSASADVQAVLASIFADVLRLGGTSGSSLPFASTCAPLVVNLLTTVFSRIRTSKKPSTALLMHARQAVERLAISHAMQKLVGVASTTTDDDVVSLFQTFLHEFTAADEDITFLSRIAVVLSDCIGATHTVTESQLSLLLSAISVAKKHANPVGASIAIAVLRRHEDLLSSVVGNYLAHQFESGIEELKRVDVTDGEAAERRAALKQISGALEAGVELARVGSVMVSQVIPQLQQGLSSDSNDVRLVTVRGFTKIFGTSLDIAGNFMLAYNVFLSKFHDPKPVIRQELVKFGLTSLMAWPTEANWHNLTPFLEAKLVDSDEGVRRSTISVVCEVAAAASSTVPKQLLEYVGQRCADKNPKVRTHATEKLMQLYRGFPHFSWIPDAVFMSIHADGGVVAIELGLEDMLPPPSKVANAVESARKSRKTKDKDHAIFDFELTGAPTGSPQRDDEFSEDKLHAAAKNATFVDAFCRLCGDLNDANWTILLKLMEKKRNLRQAVQRLFELRADVKRIGNIESPEGSEAKSGIVRLLAFLQSITHTKKGEWDAIFRAKDEKISKAFLDAVDDANLMDGYAAGAELVKKLQGRLTGDAFVFVQQGLVRRLLFPVSGAHVEELAARVGSERSLPYTKRLGSLRAAACILAAQPQLLQSLFPVLVETLALEAGRGEDNIIKPGSPTKGPTNSKAKQAEADRVLLETKAQKELLLTVLHTLAAAEVDVNSPGTAALTTLLNQQSKSMITSIGRMCIQTPHPDIAKAAAQVMCRLFPNHPKAFQQLLEALREKLGTIASGTQPYVVQAVSWLKTISVFATSTNGSIRKHVKEDILQELSPILFGAVRTAQQDDNVDAKAKRIDDVHVLFSMSALVVDACAKLMTRVATTQTAAKSTILVPMVVDELLSAYRETRHLGSGTVGACKKRLALAKQLLRLAARPGGLADVSKELTIAVVASAEDNTAARHALQRKIQVHMQKQKSDVRLFGVLLLTALSEESRAGYTHLRSVVHAIGDKMRQAQAKDDVTLGDAKALWCYGEYSIPTLVLFLAHHTFFATERESGFMGYQRVWHLLFDELFRHGTNCASFCSEMFRKLKQLDDSLDPDSTATRIVCDLASKVMIECLGQKSVRADALKPYPGAVLLPRTFVKPRDNRFPADVVYLDASVVISAHPPFKVPLFGAATPGRSLGGTSVSAANENDGAHEEEQQEGATPPPRMSNDNEEVDEQALPSTARRIVSQTPANGKSSPASKKRAREEPTEAKNSDDEDEEERDERIIHDFIVEFCKGISHAEFVELSWKTLKRQLEAAIGKKLSPAQTQFSHSTLTRYAP